MVEQRSPKPSVACSSRVSPAKRSPLGLLFFCQRFASRTRNAIATELHSVRLWLHLTRRFANIICSLCYFSRFALSRVASPLPREVLWDFFFCQRFASRTRNAIATELHSVRLWLHLTRRFANIICSLCYFSRFALSRVASPLPREVLWDFFFCQRFASRTRNIKLTTKIKLFLFP